MSFLGRDQPGDLNESWAVALKPSKERPLPRVRLKLLIPVLEALDTTRADSDAILESVGLTREAISDGDTLVYVMVIHQFLEAAAEGAVDPHMMAKVAQSFDSSRWPPLIEASRKAKTIGDFIALFTNEADQHATSASRCLTSGGAMRVLATAACPNPVWSQLIMMRSWSLCGSSSYVRPSGRRGSPTK
jgi:hypothetical protein